MRVLLDESLPRPLARYLPGHETKTVTQMGWTSLKNGALLAIAAESFDVVLTADQNIAFQQNLTKLPVSVVILIAPTNRIESLIPLVPTLIEALESLEPRTLLRVGA